MARAQRPPSVRRRVSPRRGVPRSARKRKAALQKRTRRRLSAFGRQAAGAAAGRSRRRAPGRGLSPTAGAAAERPGTARLRSVHARRGRGRAGGCGQSGAGPNPAASPCRRPSGPRVPASPARRQETPGGGRASSAPLPGPTAPRRCRAESGTPPYLTGGRREKGMKAAGGGDRGTLRWRGGSSGYASRPSPHARAAPRPPR